jgi:methionyl-tRNA formyltransferase
VLLAEGAGVIVACGEGALCITELQKPGRQAPARRRIPARHADRCGSRFDLKSAPAD